MSSIRLLFDAATPHGKMMVEAVDLLYDAQSRIGRVAGMMGMAVRTDTPPLVDADFYPLCAELGLPTSSVETAKTLFYLIASVKTKLEDSVITEFQRQVDQG